MMLQFHILKKMAGYWPVLPALVLMILLTSPPVHGKESLITLNIDPKDTADSVEATIERRDALDYDPTRHSLFPDFYYRMRTWREDMFKKLHLQASMSYDMLGQQYADGTSSQGASAGDFTFNARWLMIGEKYIKPIYLVFRLRHRHAYRDVPPSLLGVDNGLLWKTADGFTNAGFQVPDLYFNQELFDGRLTLRYGQYGPDSVFDNHSLRSAKKFFLSQIFSNNPAVVFPSYGTGFALQWRDNHNWDLSFGGSNIQSTDILSGEEINLNIGSSALFYALQGGYNFTAVNDRDARIQLMLWGNQENSENDIPSGNGVSLTFDHAGAQPTERYVARLAFSEGDAVSVDRLLMIGYGRETRKYDHFGVGLGIGRSAENHNRWQAVTELYYRWQVTKELMVTPDLQVIIGRGIDSDSTFQLVAGIRAGITF